MNEKFDLLVFKWCRLKSDLQKCSDRAERTRIRSTIVAIEAVLRSSGAIGYFRPLEAERATAPKADRTKIEPSPQSRGSARLRSPQMDQRLEELKQRSQKLRLELQHCPDRVERIRLRAAIANIETKLSQGSRNVVKR